MPGNYIPIAEGSRVSLTRPDYRATLHLNFKEDVMQQLEYIRAWRGELDAAEPRLEISP